MVHFLNDQVPQLKLLQCSLSHFLSQEQHNHLQGRSEQLQQLQHLGGGGGVVGKCMFRKIIKLAELQNFPNFSNSFLFIFFFFVLFIYLFIFGLFLCVCGILGVGEEGGRD